MFLTTGFLLASTIVCPVPAEENKVPESVRQEMQFLVGEWEVESTRTDADGQVTESKARYSVKWSEGGHVLHMRYEHEDFLGVGISGWNPATEELVETWYAPSIGKLELRYKLGSGSSWEATAETQDPTGAVAKGKATMEKNGPDAFTFTETISGETTVNVNRRIKSEPGVHHQQLAMFKPMMGRWQFRGDAPADGAFPAGTPMVATVNFEWALNGNAVVWDVHIRMEGLPDYKLHAMATWDSAAEKVISSAADTMGGADRAEWSKDGNKLIAKVVGSGPEGRTYSATSLYTLVEGAFTYQAIEQVNDGEAQDDGAVFELKRISD